MNSRAFAISFPDSDNEDTPTRSSGNKKERYFWQYNVQAKGPKGQRLVIKTQAEDPHVLNEVTDPVFSPNCSVRGIKVIKVQFNRSKPSTLCQRISID